MLLLLIQNFKNTFWPTSYLCNVVLFYVVEISKTVDMYMFLFDDILLLTKVKKPPRKVGQLSLTVIDRLASLLA